MKWNHGILIFYICFAAALFTVLILSFGVDHSLVDKDYYKLDLAYQSEYEELSNHVKNPKIKIDHLSATNDLRISPVDDSVEEVDLFFYRPSNQSHDYHLELALNGQDEIMDLSSMIKGKWKLQVRYKSHDTAYRSKLDFVVL